jgi:hypothetical protein
VLACRAAQCWHRLLLLLQDAEYAACLAMSQCLRPPLHRTLLLLMMIEMRQDRSDCNSPAGQHCVLDLHAGGVWPVLAVVWRVLQTAAGQHRLML